MSWLANVPRSRPSRRASPVLTGFHPYRCRCGTVRRCSQARRAGAVRTVRLAKQNRPIDDIDSHLDDVVIPGEAVGASDLGTIGRCPSQRNVNEISPFGQHVEVRIGLVLRVVIRCRPWPGQSGLRREVAFWIRILEQSKRNIRLVVGNRIGEKIDCCNRPAQGIDLDGKYVRRHPDLSASIGIIDILVRRRDRRRRGLNRLGSLGNIDARRC